MVFGRKKKEAEAAAAASKVAAPLAAAAAPIAAAAIPKVMAPAPQVAAAPTAAAPVPKVMAPAPQVAAAPIAAAPVPKVMAPAPQVAAAPIAAAPVPQAAAPIAAAPAALTAAQKEQQAKRAMGAKMVAASFGEIVYVLMRSPTYKHFSISDLEWMVVPPVMTQQFALAEAKKGEDGIPSPVAVVLWASVSQEVDKKLSANLTGPLRLRPDEWKSGDILWLIDAVGPPKILNGFIGELHKNVFKGRPFKARGRGEDGKPMVKVQELAAS